MRALGPAKMHSWASTGSERSKPHSPLGLVTRVLAQGNLEPERIAANALARLTNLRGASGRPRGQEPRARVTAQCQGNVSTVSGQCHARAWHILPVATQRSGCPGREWHSRVGGKDEDARSPGRQRTKRGWRDEEGEREREDEGRSGTRRNTGGAPVGIALAY